MYRIIILPVVITTMNQIVKVFDGNNIRIQVINGETWFCAKDVCQVLGISKHNDMMQNLDAVKTKFVEHKHVSDFSYNSSVECTALNVFV